MNNLQTKIKNLKKCFFDRLAHKLLIGLPFLWYILLFAFPFFIILKISFAESLFSIPPFSHLSEYANQVITFKFDLSNYFSLLEDSIYFYAFINSIELATLSTIFCFLIGYPFAYVIWKSPKKLQALLLLSVMLPSWTSFLIRIYAWMNILGVHGLLNKALMKIGLIDAPLIILDTKVAVYIGVVYSYLPFMVLPIYTCLKNISPELIGAAQDLGSKPINTLFRITIPLSLKGILAGAFLVFIPVIGEVMIPQLMGGANTLMVGNVVWQTFFNNNDWPMASTLAIVLLIIVMIPIRYFNKIEAKHIMKKDQ